MEKEIIIVKMKYSMGIIGLMSNEDEVCNGKNGMKDKVEEMSWVSENIEVLGGKKKRVKIFGESEGGERNKIKMM